MALMIQFLRKLKNFFRTSGVEVWTEGGLGNQLFQANFAHYLVSIGYSNRVTLVNMNLKHDRKFELESFFDHCTHIRIVHRATLMRRLKLRIILRVNSKPFTRLFVFKLFRYASEFEFTQSLIPIQIVRKPKILRGYFQKNFFFNYERECFDNNLRFWLQVDGPKILTQKAFTFVHYRRGDYLIHKSHGPLSPNYFANFFSSPNSVSSGPVLLASDDKGADKLITMKKPDLEITFLSMKAKEILAALLESDCLIFVGSNSSLSWWMGYILDLSSYNKTQIFFPDSWFRDVRTDELQILKSHWKVLPAKWD